MSPAPAAPVVLAADGLVVRRGARTLLDQVSLTVRAGERWVVLGPNGAGKSTLLGLLGARSFPTSGTVEVLGRRLGRVDVRELWPLVGTVGQAHRPAARLSTRQLVLTGITGTPALPLRWRPAPEQEQRVEDLVARLGLGHVAVAPASTLSTGELRRALLARALVAEPAVLLLDEPASGLDLPAREALVQALEALEGPSATVLVTHHLEEVPARTTHALLLAGGRVVAQGPVTDVLSSAPLSTAFGLPLSVRRDDGRWAARATRPDGPAAI